MSTIARRAVAALLALAAALALATAFCEQEAYAADNISGTVNTSNMVEERDYTLTGDTTIYIDADLDVFAINMGSYNLTIEGDGQHSLYFQGITGYGGKMEIKSGEVDANYSVNTGSWPAAIDLGSGEFIISGGELFIDLYCLSESTNTAYGISAGAFTMTGGKATVYCLTEENGYASGISCNGFYMSGGTLDATGETSVSGKGATGIDAAGSTTDANFRMTGGEVKAKGIAKDGDDSYGINWTADRSKNTMVISGGTLSAGGSRHGIASWVPVSVSGGAYVSAVSDHNTAFVVDGGDITISGTATQVFALTDWGTCAIEASKRDGNGGTISISDPVKVLNPEEAYIASIGSGSQTVYESSGNPAQYTLIGSEIIPTNIAITYDKTKAFPTTRLTGKEVSLHLLRNVTSNPHQSLDGDGWYVYAADPEKVDTSTSEFTCLVKKEKGKYVKLNESDEKLNANDEYYWCFNIEDDGTKPFAMSRTYTATVNDEPADEVVKDGDEEGQLYVYKKVELNETADCAWSVKVKPEGAKVTKGGTRQFTAEVYAATNDSVSWSVTSNSSSSTYIDSSGLLHAASDETGWGVTVTATSAADPSVQDSVYVSVVDYTPGIERVDVQAGRNPVCRGTRVTFSAVVEGSDIHDLSWELIGSDGSSYFDAGSNDYRQLVVGQSETASELTVRATSVADPNKYGEATVQVKDRDIVTGPIAITYDASKVSLSTSKTGRQVTQEFVNAITCPFDPQAPSEAPNGWYVYGNADPASPSSYTCLVKKVGDHYTTLQESDDLLTEDGEYYLWFNVEAWSDDWEYDHSMDLSELNITVNGKPVNGGTVIAKWGGQIEVYVRVVMKAGWVKSGDDWYYYDSNLAMVTNKWVKDGTNWYYLGADGRMVKNKWMKDSKGWCYLGNDGRMVTNAFAPDSHGDCWIGSNGYMVVATKWVKFGTDWYHITKGYMDKNHWYKDSKGWCYVGADGRMVTNGFAPDSKGMCWIGSDGYMVTSTKWIKVGDDWYHITKGYMDKSKWMKDSKGWCYLGADGKMVTNGWAKDSKGWCWMGDDGYWVSNMWVEDGGAKYYIKSNHYMAKSETLEIEGVSYTFDSSGKLIS